MKGSNSECLRCGKTFVKKKMDHKFCRSGCRTMYNRKKKGIAEPKFLSKGVNKSLQSRPSELMQSSDVSIRTSDDGLLIARQNVQYFERVIADMERNVFPIYTVAMAGAGGVAGKSGFEKLAFGLVGGLIGNKFDKQRKERLISEAKDNLRAWKNQITRLNKAHTFISQSLKVGTVKQEKKGIMKVISVNDYKSVNIPTLGINRDTPWHYLFGDPSVNFFAMLHGLPGNGKSTFSVQLADYIQKNHGDVMYIASEQDGLNRSFQDLLNSYATSNFVVSNKAKDHKFETIKKAAKDYKLIILDSVNHIGLSPKEFEQIRDAAPNTAFLAIMQSKKDGDFKGTQEWAHNCDIIIEMKNMNAYQTKSRFAPPANIKIIR